MDNSGIYLIVNVANNKLYIGSSKKLSKRIYRHKQELRTNKHVNKYLQHAWNKYGSNAFQFHIVEYTSELLLREQYWIDKLKCSNSNIGYNIASIAGNTSGIKPSKETLLKMSLANLGKKLSEETKLKIKNTLTGRKQSESHKQKRLLTRIGKELSDETKRRISKTKKDRNDERLLNPFQNCSTQTLRH